MFVNTFRYNKDTGWSIESFPKCDSSRTIVLVFGAKSYFYNPEPISELALAYPNSIMLGCSTSGEIFHTYVKDETLSVAVVQFKSTDIKSASAFVINPEESFNVGAAIAEELKSDSLKGILVLSDGLIVNGSELVKGLNSELSVKVVVTGGLAGDGDKFEQTWVLEGSNLATGIVSAVGFYGDHVCIGHGSQGGWDVFGPERIVTKSIGNILYELDGKPALELYKKYLGDRASGLPATALLFPLMVRSGRDSETKIVRTVLGIDEDSQSMTFAGDIPQGWLAQLMRATFEGLIDGAVHAANSAKMESPSGILSIAISCVGRRLVLGERIEEELEATMNVLPKGTQQIGFYSYGEISPYATGYCDLHNQTMTLTTISEED